MVFVCVLYMSDDAGTNERVIVVYRRERLRQSPTTR